MRRKLSSDEIARANADALVYMRGQADIMEKFGDPRPTDTQIEAAAARCAEAVKRLWRLQERAVS